MKVFITNAPKSNKALKIQSNDFLITKAYTFALSHMLDNNTEPGEKVKIVVCHRNDKNNDETNRIFIDFKAEITKIVERKKLVTASKDIFEHVNYKTEAEGNFRNNSVMEGFRSVVGHIHEGDEVFTDLCYGISLHNQLLFVASYYALLTTTGVKCSLYGGIYNKNTQVMELVSLENLLLLSKIAGKMYQGSRELVDSLINIDAALGKVEQEADEDNDENEDDHQDNDQD